MNFYGGTNNVSASKVDCEGFSNYDQGFLGTIKICSLQNAVVEEKRVAISTAKNVKMRGITLSGNKNIRYLMENVGSNFPYLIGYDAGDCAIKSVSRKDFHDLPNLRELVLHSNELTMIAADTFRDLKQLERIHLRKNLFLVSTKLNC